MLLKTMVERVLEYSPQPLINSVMVLKAVMVDNDFKFVIPASRDVLFYYKIRTFQHVDKQHTVYLLSILRCLRTSPNIVIEQCALECKLTL